VSRGVDKVWTPFHRFSLRHGMPVGTGLIILGVGATPFLQAYDMDIAAGLSAFGVAGVGITMNTIAWGALGHDSFRHAEGGFLKRTLTAAIERTDATGVKLWSWGVKLLGGGMVASHAADGHAVLASIGNGALKLGGGLIVAGLVFHAAPRAVRSVRKQVVRWSSRRSRATALEVKASQPPQSDEE